MGERPIVVEFLNQPTVTSHEVEIVERKGVGHPDSICDAITEEISVALSREYIARYGRVLHHNIDKGLLVAGEVTRAFGGGRVDVPMKLIVGDRATFSVDGERIDVPELAASVARRWFRDNLRFVDSDAVLIEPAIHPGSTELSDIFSRGNGVMEANDTSAAVGYAPMSDTESLVLEIERYINSFSFKERHPSAGEDVKVMGFRTGSDLLLTIAMPLIDRFIGSEAEYWAAKEAIAEEVSSFALVNRGSLNSVRVDINTLDEKERGSRGIYLSVTGTSAEDADSGEVGRGNRANGVIALNRPSGMEAAAGKNPTSHVGKIYSILAHRIAKEIYAGIDEVAEVYVWLASQIGQPIDWPRVASAQLALKPGASRREIAVRAKEIIDLELAEIAAFTGDLAEGRYRVW